MTDIDYNVVESSRATKPRIDVDIREVKIVIPEDSDIDPEQLAEEKKEWIQEKTQKFEEYRQQAPERSFEPGEKFLYLGKEHQLKYGQVDSIQIENGELRVPVSERENADKLVEEFYKAEAKNYIEPRVEEYAERMSVDYNSIGVRNQRTLWGSCSPKQNLSFNCRLMMAPAEVIDYVIVHELAHLKERNHTKKFWRIVEEYHQDYKRCSRWLEENAPKMIFTKDDL